MWNQVVPAATCNLRRLSILHPSSMATSSETYSFDSQGEYQRPKPSILQSFYHRRVPSSNGETLPTFPLEVNAHFPKPEDIMVGQYVKNNPGALGELQGNQQEAAPRFARPTKDEHANDSRGRSRSPTKNPISNIALKVTVGKEPSKLSRSREESPTKPKKLKTGMAGLLRPKSLRNLSKLVSDEDIRSSKDKENRTPDETPSSPAPPPPIFAQFTSDPSYRQKPDERSSIDVTRNVTQPELFTSVRPAVRERPKSYQVPPQSRPDMPPPSPTKSRFAQNGSRKPSDEEKSPTKTSRNKVLSAFATFGHGRSKSTSVSPPPEAVEKVLDPKDTDKHLEAMLDRRNIPENQRYKMRNLNETIKMEFIRQDWAEMHASKSDRPGTTDSRRSDENGSVGQGSDNEDKPKRNRGKSFTLSRGKKEPSSPVKKQKGDGTLSRHLRSKSTENISADVGSSSLGVNLNTGILSKIKLQQGPVEYVAYLRKVQKPELVEVGKIHKLRILLRNETVAWIEEFIQQGGMKEIVGLLHRIMEVEWRFVICHNP